MPITLESPLVSTDWLADHIDDPALRILDCSLLAQFNDDGSYQFVSAKDAWQQGHIPRSIYVDVSTELSDTNHEFALMMPAVETLAATLQAKGVGDGTTVICYDRSNHAWAARVWWMLRVCGFYNAAVLDGGWLRWQQEQRAESTQNDTYPPAQAFTLSPRPDLMADKDAVLGAIDDADTLLLHSLPLPMFTGETSPYARPGRIPGSQHLYCGNLIDETSNRYLGLDRIRDMFGKTDALQSPRVITYCGGGIAASANALALTLLGHHDVAVYDGSLTEWTADPALPLETG